MRKQGVINNKIVISILVTTLMVSVLTGCGEQQPVDPEIELIDPVGVATDYEIADYRNIYKAEVEECVISPNVHEYQYTTSEKFGEYGVLPGDDVSEGDVIIYADTEAVEDSIESLQDEIKLRDEDHTEEITSLYENRYDAVKNEYKASCDYMAVKNDEPSEDEPWYSGWAAGIMPLESNYKNACLNRKRIDTSISESEELYNLESAYNEERLAKLEEKRTMALIKSREEGVLVALNYYSDGDSILKNSEVAAIGDVSCKVLYAPYMSAKTLDKLDDLYALVNGKRYEISYETIDQNEYARLKQKNDDVYMPFVIEDDNNELKYGDSAVLVIIEDKAENVLTVPSDAITKENGQAYVYVLDNGESVATPVEIGLSGSVFTEILSGVSQGDKILSKSAVATTSNRRTLSLGSSSQEFKSNGMLIYPTTEWIENPAKYGQAYVNEVCVSKNEAVTEGQELIKLDIVPDSNEISRLQRKISRLSARLATLEKRKAQNYSDEVDYSLEQAIRQKKTAISRYEEELGKLTEYSGTVTLSAKCDGIVINITELKPGDYVNYKDALVCVADSSESILAVDNTGSKLGFGKEVEVSFKNRLGQATKLTGTVVNVVDTALSKSLKSKTALIRFSDEDAMTIAEFGGSFVSDMGGWGRSLFSVTAQTSQVDNCVVVPRSAVIVKNGDSFVRVIKNNRAELVQFISGGYDMQNNWVVLGLDEGTEICLD